MSRSVAELVALRDLGDLGAAEELRRLSERATRAERNFGQLQRLQLGRILLAQLLFGWIP